MCLTLLSNLTSTFFWFFWSSMFPKTFFCLTLFLLKNFPPLVFFLKNVQLFNSLAHGFFFYFLFTLSFFSPHYVSWVFLAQFFSNLKHSLDSLISRFFRFLDSLIPWFPWFLDSLDSLDSLIPWFLDSLVLWFPWFPWFLDSLVLWFLDSLVLWFLDSLISFCVMDFLLCSV